MSYEAARAILNRSVSRPTLFTVRMPNRRVSGRTNQYLDFFCSSTAIPEVRMETRAINGHENMGLVRNQPVAMVFGKPFTINVIENSDFTTYRELRSWLNATTLNANGDALTTRNQRMQYYNTYVEDIELIKLEQSNNIEVPRKNGNGTRELIGYREVMRVKFINAHPVSISQVDLNTEAENQYTTFSTGFSYESYQVSYNGLGYRDVPGDLANIIRLA